MRIRNKTASALWRFMLVAFATYGLLDGAGILAGKYLTGFPPGCPEKRVSDRRSDTWPHALACELVFS